MKNIVKKGFTLVELLVSISILAIISVVAYQSFGGATNKAVGARKISDVQTIETSLQMYRTNKGFYPPTDILSDTNKWGYNSGENANKSNTLKVTYNGLEIASIVSAGGGGKVTANGGQIGSKGTISQKTLGKQYLSKDLYDPEVGDIKVGSDKKMIDSGIGKYVYAIYKKGTSNTRGDAYNIAYTVKKDESDSYVTKIVGDYDEESCYENSANCPKSLIGPGSDSLENDTIQKLNNGIIDTTSTDQGIPYPVADFSQ